MDKLRYLVILFSVCLPLICGCDSNPKKVGSEPVSDISKDMERVLKDVSKEDTITLYWLFSGIETYIDKYPGITKNSQAFILFKTVKERYGKKDKWLDVDGDSNDPNDIIEAELIKLGFDKPADFTDESRLKFVNAFKVFEDGALRAYKGKKDAK